MPKSSRTRRPSSAHPRSRGEHFSWITKNRHRVGSSPLARGTHQTYPAKGGFFGLIPAHAGNTRSTSSGFTRTRAHPRSRREYTELSSHDFFKRGSSPLMRGALLCFGSHAFLAGFIPARAGNTGQVPAQHQCCGVHPRSRGEHALHAIRGVLLKGSSPLARGTQKD